MGQNLPFLPLHSHKPWATASLHSLTISVNRPLDSSSDDDEPAEVKETSSLAQRQRPQQTRNGWRWHRPTDGGTAAVALHRPQDPRYLYGRDGKFRPTFKSGTEKRLFSVPLLMTWYPQNAPNCTDLHLFSKISPEVTLPAPQNWGGDKPLPRLLSLDERPPCHFFRASNVNVNQKMFNVAIKQPGLLRRPRAAGLRGLWGGGQKQILSIARTINFDDVIRNF